MQNMVISPTGGSIPRQTMWLTVSFKVIWTWTSFTSPWRWRKQGLPKHCYPNILHGVPALKTMIPMLSSYLRWDSQAASSNEVSIENSLNISCFPYPSILTAALPLIKRNVVDSDGATGSVRAPDSFKHHL